MKIDKKILLGAFCLFAFACSDEYNEAFETTPDERMGALISKYTEIIQSSEHGWYGHYYSNPGELGAYTMVFRFNKDGKVAMNWSVRNELDEGDYSIKSIEKPLLSFDTYCNFSKFADPSLMMDGEVQFSILGVSQSGDTLFMEERIKKSPFNLIRAKAEMWDDIKKFNVQNNHLIRERESVAKPFYYTLNIEGWDSDMLLTFDDNRMLASLFYTQNGTMQRRTMSINFFPKGFEFMEPLEVNGVKVKSFEYDNTLGVHRVVDAGVKGKFSYQSQTKYIIPGLAELYFGPKTFGGSAKYTSLGFRDKFDDVALEVTGKKFAGFSYSPYGGAFSSLELSFSIEGDLDEYGYLRTYTIRGIDPQFKIENGVVIMSCSGFKGKGYGDDFTQEQIDAVMSSELGQEMQRLLLSSKGWNMIPYSMEREFSSNFYIVNNEDPSIFFAFGEIAADEE